MHVLLHPVFEVTARRKIGDFNVQLRLAPNLNELDWLVLPTLLQKAMDLELQIQARKVASRKGEAVVSSHLRGKKRKAVGLRVSDPW